MLLPRTGPPPRAGARGHPAGGAEDARGTGGGELDEPTATAAAPGRATEGVVLLSPGSTAPQETTRLADLARTMASSDGWGAVTVAHMRFAPPGLLDAVAQVVEAGVRRVRVVPLLVFEDRVVREHLAGLLEAARRRHPGIDVVLTATLARSPALLVAVRTLLEGPTS